MAQQDAQYAASLEADEQAAAEEAAAVHAALEAKAQQAAAEAEIAAAAAPAAATAEERRELRIQKAEALPHEPPAAADVSSVAVRTRGGVRVSRRFMCTSSLRAVVEWLEGLEP